MADFDSPNYQEQVIEFEDGSGGEEEDQIDSDEEDEKPKKRMKGSNQLKKVATEEDKDKGRRKISIEYIQKKEKRHITFSKRKAGIMKKAYELATLTGTQVLLLVVSETGIVYTYTTSKFQPLVAPTDAGLPSDGQKLIQACLATADDDSDGSSSPLPNSTATPIASTSSTRPLDLVHGGQVHPKPKPPAKAKAPPVKRMPKSKLGISTGIEVQEKPLISPGMDNNLLDHHRPPIEQMRPPNNGMEYGTDGMGWNESWKERGYPPNNSNYAGQNGPIYDSNQDHQYDSHLHQHQQHPQHQHPQHHELDNSHYTTLPGSEHARYAVPEHNGRFQNREGNLYNNPLPPHLPHEALYPNPT